MTKKEYRVDAYARVPYAAFIHANSREEALEIAEKLHGKYTVGVHHIDVNWDMERLSKVKADIWINTSCEHMYPMTDEFNPKGLCVFQSTNFTKDPSHINCVDTLDDLSEKIIKEQIALLRSPGGRTASGASGIILKTVETFGNLPGEIIDGFRGGISQDFSQTGVTEEFCVPILEKNSKLTYNVDFFCGYSPERINPGDKENTLTKIKKCIFKVLILLLYLPLLMKLQDYY